MVSNAMRLLEERHMANKIDLVIWSHKMDLLALSNYKGEVCLHRLNWQKAWSLPPPADDVTVKGIAWRPDGKVIAIGYSNGETVLIEVENKEIIKGKNATASGGEISLLVWIEDKEEMTKTNMHETCNTYLPKLPHISRSFGSLTDESMEEFDDTKLVQDQHYLNFLLVGDTSGKISISVFGLLQCGNIVLPENMNCTFVSAEMSKDLKHLFVICKEEGVLKLLIYNISVISKFRQQIHFLAYKHGVLLSLMDYLESTMSAINESYENMLLLEMESKLSKYCDSNPDYSVSASLLELLVFGMRSDDLDMLLLNQLTEKGMRKVSRSIELSHCNIQKFVLKHLHSACTNVMYHLCEYLGMARMTESYQVLGLEESIIVKAYRAIGSFLLKSNELLVVVDISLKKYKAFSTWLESLFEKIQGESKTRFTVSKDEYHPLSQMEAQGIADYIYGLDKKKDGEEQYSLDLVGQYLQNKELTEPVNTPTTSWDSLVKNTSLSKNDSVLVRERNLSLVQQKKKFKEAMESLMKMAANSVCPEPVWIGDIGFAGSNSKVTSVVSTSSLIISFTTLEGLILVTISSDSVLSGYPVIQSTNAHFGVGLQRLKVIDQQFYLNNTLSLLLEETNPERRSIFFQLPVSSVQGQDSAVDVCSSLEPGSLRYIENMVGAQLAVSGARKVGVIVSENRHKVRTYEMEVEEDEEDEEDNMEDQATSLNISIPDSVE